MRPGDEIVSINGHRIRDQIDLRFYSADDHLDIEARRAARPLCLSLEKQPDEPLGLVLAEPKWRRCSNRCLFCFVDQMPQGLRPSLYVKDEDFRLSFLHGNYLTLTNLSKADRDRIVYQRLSPLYVSVHATQESVRRRLLGSERPAPIMPLMRDLIDNGIKLHTQIVLCPGINDSGVLERTVHDLVSLHPGVASIAVVPVGLTRYRHGLPAIKRVDENLARQLIAGYGTMQKRLRKRFKSTVLYFSDEFYLLAGLDIPKSFWYDDYPQVENGVGMARMFLDKIEKYSLRLPPKLKTNKTIVLVTGELAKPILEKLVRTISSVKKLDAYLIALENKLFGPQVTVSGLLCGRDIIMALGGMRNYDLIALPDNLINADGEFIDGITVRRLIDWANPSKVVFGLDALVNQIVSWAG